MTEIVIFGTGGHAKVVFDIVNREGKYKVVAFLSDNPVDKTFGGLPHIGIDELQNSDFKAGIVGIGDNFTRAKVAARIEEIKPGLKFVAAVHPDSVVARDVEIGEGSVIMAGTTVNSGGEIGKHCILNTGCNIDHDNHIGKFASVAPGCTLGGNVRIGEYSAVSLGTNIIHGCKVGQHTVVGAGSLVLSDIESWVVAYGHPCRVIKPRSEGDRYL